MVAAAVFWLSGLLLAYVYAGYPALVWAWARLAPRRRPAPAPVGPGTEPAVTVLVIAYNEAARVAGEQVLLDPFNGGALLTAFPLTESSQFTGGPFLVPTRGQIFYAGREITGSRPAAIFPPWRMSGSGSIAAPRASPPRPNGSRISS